MFYFADSNEIAQFLEILDRGKAYVVTFELILDWYGYKKGAPSVYLSNPKLNSKFIHERIITTCHLYNIVETNFIYRGGENPRMLVSYKEINLFS